MITLYTFGPAFGLPDPSPFVTKAEVLLKLSGLPYRCQAGPAALQKAPKGKLPFIDDDGQVVADSTFIRFHLEDRHGIDFDKALSAADKGAAWACEKLLEDHLYWAVVRERWMDDANFKRGPVNFFKGVPALIRPFVVAMIHRQVRRNLHGQGMGRHTLPELNKLAARGIDALAGMLGDKPWLTGQTPCGADATLFAFVAGLLCPLFDSAARIHGERHANLIAYRDRGMARWFPDQPAAPVQGS